MKFIPGIYMAYLQNRSSRRNLKILLRFLLLLILLIFAYSALFHKIMEMEGHEYSLITGLYWTLTVMSTLGFGDITFSSDTGLIFSIIVLLTGTMFMLVLLPFLFIQFFYAPWMEAQSAARAPRDLPDKTQGHIVLTKIDSVTTSFISKLKQYQYSYVVVVPDLDEALRLNDQGFSVVFGDLDNPETYERVRIQEAAMCVTTASDELNTHVAFTVRGLDTDVPVISTARNPASVDIMEMAGCTHVFQLGEMLGQAMARRVVGNDAMAHVIGSFGDLVIAEATAHRTPLVGKTLSESKLRENVSVGVVGIWERGRLEFPSPHLKIGENTVLVLAGTKEQIEDYNELFCIYNASDAPIVIIGGGRVGRAAGNALNRRGMDYRIVERLTDRVYDREKYVLGDAAELETLEAAGLMEATTALITTSDDDTNVYLTIYCRRLRPDIQIISRSNLERNVPALHRAGSDFVLSYASMGASAMFNVLKHSHIVMLAEGLHFFRVSVPESLAGKSVAGSGIRQACGCNIVAISVNGTLDVNPDPLVQLDPGAEIILAGTAESEEQFLKQYMERK
jgi:Trk K+ transport system NAD-binding subunit